MTRINCIVPFCQHTRGDRKNDPITPGMEWICANHYRAVDRNLKTTRSRFKRRFGTSRRGLRADALCWGRIKKQAIEKAAGLL